MDAKIAYQTTLELLMLKENGVKELPSPYETELEIISEYKILLSLAAKKNKKSKLFPAAQHVELVKLVEDLSLIHI